QGVKHASSLAVLQGGSDGLLSVREAAEGLGICTATIYGLCADGARTHPDPECDPDRASRPGGVRRGEAGERDAGRVTRGALPAGTATDCVTRCLRNRTDCATR